MSELSDIENYYELMVKANSIFLKLNSENMRLRNEKQQTADKCVWRRTNTDARETGCGYHTHTDKVWKYCPFCGKEIEVTE